MIAMFQSPIEQGYALNPHAQIDERLCSGGDAPTLTSAVTANWSQSDVNSLISFSEHEI
jgi:hypothetical protein